MNLYYLLFLFALLYTLQAQDNNWKLFNFENSGLPDNQIQAIAIDNNNAKWIGTAKGLAYFDGITWKVYDTSNSALPSSVIYSIYQDVDKTLIGTGNGLVKFDGINWENIDVADTLFTSPVIIGIEKDKDGHYWIASETNLVQLDRDTWEVLHNMSFIGSLSSLTIDNNNNIWVGDFNHASFNGVLWQYDHSHWKFYKLNEHSPLISSFPYALKADKHNNLWMGTGGTTGGSLVKIAEDNWTILNHSTSGLPSGGIRSLAIEDTTVWIGTSSGFVAFNGLTWLILNSANSALPENFITSIAIDQFGNKWIGTLSSGIAVYKQGGIITSAKDHNNSGKFELSQNYPNPFNNSTVISFRIPEAANVQIRIYDCLGKEVYKLLNEFRNEGEYSTKFNADKLSSGVYFYQLRTGEHIYTKMMQLMK